MKHFEIKRVVLTCGEMLRFLGRGRCWKHRISLYPVRPAHPRGRSWSESHALLSQRFCEGPLDQADGWPALGEFESLFVGMTRTQFARGMAAL